MNNYKICVYAISKNEEKFVNRWVESMSEADKIIVLDTGSDDKTVELLKNAGVEVHEKVVDPWRFDVARNESLKLIPEEYEICVCTDLDEVLDPGWREKILAIWDKDITRIRYLCNWSFDEYGNPATTYFQNKIHRRDSYKWSYPVHEVLMPLGEEKEVISREIVLNHYPDRTKSRNSYLPLLELAVEEDPQNDRNMHYLGREYMYYLNWEKCIETLKKHLELEKSTWKDERAASMRYIARSYHALNKNDEAKEWYIKATEEAPYLREAYVELGYLYYEEKNYQDAYIYLHKALEIKEKSNSYINEDYAWNSFVYDLLSICAFDLGKYSEAVDSCKLALEMDKNNLRIQLNLEEMEKFV